MMVLGIGGCTALLIAGLLTATGGLVAVDPATFAAGPPRGLAQAVWNFRVVPEGDGTRLVTEQDLREKVDARAADLDAPVLDALAACDPRDPATLARDLKDLLEGVGGVRQVEVWGAPEPEEQRAESGSLSAEKRFAPGTRLAALAESARDEFD